MFIRLFKFQRQLQAIEVDLNEQKASDADPRAIQQIVFQEFAGGADNTKVRLYTILEKSKFYKDRAKVL